MKKNMSIIEVLKDHEQRLLALERPARTKALDIQTNHEDSLPGRILSLRTDGFFSEPRTSEETWEKLQPQYPCERNRVAMALMRLAEKKQLRKVKKTIQQKEYKAYAG